MKLIRAKRIITEMIFIGLRPEMAEALGRPESTSLKEFILSDGRHYKLAVVDYTNASGQTAGYYGYVTTDKRFYNHGISSTGPTGAKILDAASFDLTSADGNKFRFINWV